MEGKDYVFTKNSQMASIGAIFTSTCHTKQLNSWPNSSVSRMVNHIWLSACQGKMGPQVLGLLKAARALVDVRQA